MVLGRRAAAQHRHGVERPRAAVPQLRPDPPHHAGSLDLARHGGASLYRRVARPHLHGHDRRRAHLRQHAPRLDRRDLGEGAPRNLVPRGEVGRTPAHGRRRAGGCTAHEGGGRMRTLLAFIAAGVLLGATAGLQAKLPPPAPKTDAEKKAEDEKAAATKTKEAADLNKAIDKAVANYKRNSAATAKK